MNAAPRGEPSRTNPVKPTAALFRIAASCCTRESLRAASSAACSCQCAATRHSLETAAKLTNSRVSSHSATIVSSSNVGGSSGSALANGACTACCGPPTWVRFAGARATPRCASSAAGSQRTTRAAGCSRRPPNDAIVVEVALPWRSPPARKPSADEVKCAVRSRRKSACYRYSCVVEGNIGDSVCRYRYYCDVATRQGNIRDSRVAFRLRGFPKAPP